MQKIIDKTQPIYEAHQRIYEMIPQSTYDIVARTTSLQDMISQAPTICDIVAKSPTISDKLSEEISISSNIETSLKEVSLIEVATNAISAIKVAYSKFFKPLAENFIRITDYIATSVQSFANSAFVDWAKTVDFKPLLTAIYDLAIDSDTFEKYKNLDKVFLQAMYDSKWFPYAAWTADFELLTEINGILNTSRGMSKRCEKRIDRAIISFYTKAEINNIRKQWNNSDLESHIKKALSQSLNAYLRKEYALVIPFLATMWEGIIKDKTIENTQKPKEDFKKLVSENGYDDILSDYYNDKIISTCYGKEEVVEGVPNRHGVAHSWYNKYPSQKSALNAIIITDFIINLKPINKQV